MLLKLLNFWAYRSRVECIQGHGGTGTYLIRYHLINNRFCKLYLHYFLRSDLDDPHDHPWDFWTLMLRGAYREELYDWRTRSFKNVYRHVRCNSLVRRRAEDIHRIVVSQSYDMDVADNWRTDAPMTLFFALRKRKTWGFVEDPETAPKWKLWDRYLRDKYLTDPKT